MTWRETNMFAEISDFYHFATTRLSAALGTGDAEFIAHAERLRDVTLMIAREKLTPDDLRAFEMLARRLDDEVLLVSPH